MIVRPVDLADVGALHALEVDCFGPDAWSVSSIADEVRAPTRAARLLADDGELVGYAVVMTLDGTADLHRVAVAPSRRRQGAASTLLGEVIAVARRRGCDRMLLEVRADNAAAVALYEAHGFGVLHRRRDYYGRGADALVMERREPADE